MPAPLLFDVSHTSHTRARTGIQRVTRSLLATLGAELLPVTHDPHARRWRVLERWENENLAGSTPGAKRGVRWPLLARVRGRARRLLGAAPAALPPNSGLLASEIFSPEVARALPEIFAAARGPRVALFHDAVALKFPELTPVKTVARYPAYLIELLAFDGIAAISEESRDALVDYWRWLGAASAPPVVAIPLGVDPPGTPAAAPLGTGDAQLPTVLSVGTLEGRKNHLALLEACEALWARGRRFQLHVIGLAQAETGGAALARLRTLQAAGRPLRYDGAASEAVLTRAYAECAFTVYPSLIEGFGLPVLESLVRGKPCVCSARGALGESARHGGCLALPAVDAASLAAGIERLLLAPEEVRRLAAEARARKIRTWRDYATDLVGWMRALALRR